MRGCSCRRRGQGWWHVPPSRPSIPSPHPGGRRAGSSGAAGTGHVCGRSQKRSGEGPAGEAASQASRPLRLLPSLGPHSCPSPAGPIPGHQRRGPGGWREPRPARKQLVLANKTQCPRQRQSKRELGKLPSEDPPSLNRCLIRWNIPGSGRSTGPLLQPRCGKSRDEEFLQSRFLPLFAPMRRARLCVLFHRPILFLSETQPIIRPGVFS